MSKLEAFLAPRGGSESSTPEPSAEGQAPAATDVKPAAAPETPDAAAPAPSAGQATDSPADAPKAETPAGEPAEKPARQRDEKGKFVAKAEVSDEVLGLRAALQQTREENRKLKAARETPAKRTSFYEDADKAGNELMAQMRSENAQRFYTYSEAQAKERHADFDEVVGPLLRECVDDEVLGQQVFDLCNGHPDPAEAFYRHARFRGELREHGGDIGKYREAIETPLTARIKELETKLAAAEKRQTTLSQLPTSLSQTPNNPPDAKGAEPAGKRSLGSITGEARERRMKRRTG